MVNIGLGGKLSNGKTVTGVRFAYENGQLKNKKVISNIQLNHAYFTNYVHLPNERLVDYLLDNYEDQVYLQKMFRNSVLFIDEIVNLLNARRSLANLNEVITTFLMMVGKLDCDVIFTYQVLESQVDKRLREICNIFIKCLRLTEQGDYVFFGSRILKEKIMIALFIEVDFDVFGKKVFQEIYDPSMFYPMYKTREIILLNRERYLKS